MSNDAKIMAAYEVLELLRDEVVETTSDEYHIANEAHVTIQEHEDEIEEALDR